MTVKRPVLRWHGGKWKLAPWILSHFPPHRIYVEPYGGAASVLLRKPRSEVEVYNDLDGDVVNLFRVIRDRPADIVRDLSLTPFARDEFDLAYEPTDDPLERARRMFVRSSMGFGSRGHNVATRTGFRSNFNRPGTTPAHEWRSLPSALHGIVERWGGVIIENRHAEDVMRQHDSHETLHYIDPPYVPCTRSQKSRRSKIYSHEMTDADHEAMAECLRGLSGMVILSGSGSGLYDRLFGDWRSASIAAMADGARKRVETLWFNAAAWDRRPQGELLSHGPVRTLGGEWAA